MQERKKKKLAWHEESPGEDGLPVKKTKDPDEIKEQITEQNRALQKIISKYQKLSD